MKDIPETITRVFTKYDTVVYRIIVPIRLTGPTNPSVTGMAGASGSTGPIGETFSPTRQLGPNVQSYYVHRIEKGLEDVLFVYYERVKEGMNKQIEYKSTYNEDRGLPEPEWGPLMSEISPDYLSQCPTCGSHKMYASAHPDDPDEIFLNETVRCGDCGRITDWYEAHSQFENHYTDKPLEVIHEHS